MANVADILTDNLGVWTSAIERRSSAGRGRSKKFSLYGIEKLRALILDLAVRGKLVPQNVSDEPATELLKAIKLATKELATTGNIGKAREFNRQSSAMPFDLPSSWAWVQVSDIGHDWGQKIPDSKFTYIDVGSIDQHLGRVEEPSVLTADAAPSRARKCVREGTVIYSTVRPYLLNIAIIDRTFDPEPIASTAFAVIHPYKGIMASFVYRYLRSPAFIAYVEACQTGIAYPAINDKQFFSAPFPLPPLAEQQRIVAKVDELMALCDALEAETYQAIEAHELLVANLLATLTRSADANEIAANWARIETHFDTLFTTEASIDQLKQTILQLAVMGKLVPQDPNDEPASELLKRISAAKSARKSRTGDARIKVAPNPQPSALNISLPSGWAAQSFENLFLFIDYRGSTPPKTEEGIPLITAKNIRMGYLNREPYEYISNETFDYWMTRGFPELGDLFFTTEAPLGNVCLNDIEERFALAQRAICLQPYGEVNTKFLMYALMSKPMQLLIDRHATGMTAKGIKASNLKPLPIPIPPLAEQHRIVTKIDQLVAYCEALKSLLAEGQRQQVQFADAIASKAMA